MTTLLKQSAGIEESYDALNIIKAKGERDGWTEEQFGLNQIDFSCLPCVPRLIRLRILLPLVNMLSMNFFSVVSVCRPWEIPANRENVLDTQHSI